MRVLFLGDVLGRSGRRVIADELPQLRERLKLDFVVANAENAAGGFGITPGIAEELFEAGIDCLTGGNHTFQQKQIIPLMDQDRRIMRPVNYPDGTPGRGVELFELEDGRRLLVINVMGRVFMDPLDNPFHAVDKILNISPLKDAAEFILIDIHGEASSEKMAMGHFADGRASLVVGSHTHVPTADTLILPGGTAYQTDAGMCGDYDSIIGMDKDEPLHRFVHKIGRARFTPALGPGTLCGVYVESDDATGLASRVSPVRVGANLQNLIPEL